MNPFGSSDEEDEGQQRKHDHRNHVSGSAAASGSGSKKIHYPGDLNPFGEDDEEQDDEDEEVDRRTVIAVRGRAAADDPGKWKQVTSCGNRNGKSIDVSIRDQRTASTTPNNKSGSSNNHNESRYDDSLNPFGSDGDDDEDDEYNDSSSITTNSTNATTTEPSSLASGSGSATPIPKPRTSLNHNNALSQPVSRETTPIPLRRSIGSNVSRSSLDSRARKSNSIVKPSVPPPPAPGSPATPGSTSLLSADQSPLRPRRSPKHKAPAPRPGNLTPGTTDKWVTVATVVGIAADSQTDRGSNATAAESAENLQPDRLINPDHRVTDETETCTGPAADAGATECNPTTSTSSISHMSERVLPVPAVRRISRTPSVASEETAISLSSTLELDSHSQEGDSNSCSIRNQCIAAAGGSQADLTSGNSIASDPNVSLTVSESSPSPSASFSSIPSDVRGEGVTKNLLQQVHQQDGISISGGSPSPVRRGMHNKKRPAPAPPQAIRRTVCGSLNSIQFDLNAIGDRLAVIQGQVNELEDAFRRDAAAAAAAAPAPPAAAAWRSAW